MRKSKTVLTDEQKREVYELTCSGEATQKEIADMFGISSATVCNIRRDYRTAERARQREKASSEVVSDIRDRTEDVARPTKREPLPDNFKQPASKSMSCSGPNMPAEENEKQYVYIVANQSLKKVVAFFYSQDKAHVFCRALNSALEEQAGDGIAKFTYAVFPVICMD